jgi:ElaB/YqjD/DUF883 family membrane-anchored ribosome-binding protein
MRTESNAAQMVDDLRSVTRDAEELVNATASESSERTRNARARLTEAIAAAKEACVRWEQKALEGAKATDKVIREHPYQSIGIALGLGILIGVLVTRK